MLRVEVSRLTEGGEGVLELVEASVGQPHVEVGGSGVRRELDDATVKLNRLFVTARALVFERLLKIGFGVVLPALPRRAAGTLRRAQAARRGRGRRREKGTRQEEGGYPAAESVRR